MSRTTFYQRNYIGWPPILVSEYADSDSAHWEQQAQLAQSRLAEKLGDDYRLWAEITWPGDTVFTQSWKQIHDTCQSALNMGDNIYYELECTCLPNATVPTCPVCKANARLREAQS